MKAGTARLALLAAALLVAASCSSEPPSPAQTPTGPTPAPTAVLRIDLEIARLPLGQTLSAAPRYVLMPDGRFLSRANQNPLLAESAYRNYEVRTLTGEGVRAMVDLARTAGLDAEALDLGPSQDLLQLAPFESATIVFNDGQVHRVHRIDGFTLRMKANPTDPEGRARRKAVLDFYEGLAQPARLLPEGTASEKSAYSPDQVLVFADVAGGGSGGLAAWDLVDPAAMEQVDPKSPTRCGVVSRTDLEAFLAGQEEPFTQDYSAGPLTVSRLFVRPLLPDETGCPPG